MDKQTRSSNLELMRIVMMLLIVSHHYVVNSGVLNLWTPATITANGAFLTIWGMWGKAAINSFVMVTGWFMCRSRLTWKKYVRLLALLVGIYTLTTTFLASGTAFSEVGWYCTLYLLSAYLCIYEPAWASDRGRVSRLFAFTVFLCVASVASIMAADHLLGFTSSHAYWFVTDSGKVLTLAFGVTCFLWFKGLRLRPSAAVNAIASTTFGVLLIHAHSDCMRSWLWGRVVNVPDLYHNSNVALMGMSALVALAVFAVCSSLDLLRIKLVEPHFLGWLDGQGSVLAERVGQYLRRLQP